MQIATVKKLAYITIKTISEQRIGKKVAARRNKKKHCDCSRFTLPLENSLI